MLHKVDIRNDWQMEYSNNKTTFICPNLHNGKGRVPYGFDFKNESALNIMDWYGFRFKLKVKDKDSKIAVTAGFYSENELSLNLEFSVEGIHEIDVKLNQFPIESVRTNIWREFTKLVLEGDIEVLEAAALRGNVIAAHMEVRGKCGAIGESLTYTAVITNCSESAKRITISQSIDGWESLYPVITPSSLLLEAGESREVDIQVVLHDYIASGGHEVSKIRFIPDGDSSAEEVIEIYTLCRLSHPFIYHNKEGWANVAGKLSRNSKFKPEFDKLVRDADSWEVKPPLPLTERDYCYDTFLEHYLMSAAYVYSITGDIKYAEKIGQFFRYFINTEDGYPVKKKGCSQSYVQEGHFFQHLALAYDMIYDAGVLSEEDHKGIELCFRIYMEILDWHICNGHISNWILSELTGAVYCAMVLQDFERVNRFVFGNGGSIPHLQYGAFNDGWWYECSVGYNIWVSSMYIHTAHALLPFGINILHTHFKIPFNKQVGSSYPGRDTKIRFGMYNEKWGGIRKNYICIKDLFDAPIPFLDYRGVLFAINDSDEKKISGVHFGSTYDLAYTYYKDPAYIPVIEHFDSVDPVFGHEELPKAEEGLGEQSACSDNIGIAMLRSQGKNREPREQIQAVLRYGSHGYAHGHYDRTELLSIMRYGRSFFNPEHVWWGYGHFMYKFYVQNSNTKNMVVVDGKMQVPADSKRILFSNGEYMSAAGVTTSAKWSYPPFGGMVYNQGETLRERAAMNASDLNSYDAAPYGELTEFTETIEQTRVMAMTDDYIVLFDYVKGEKEHTFESLFQVKGFLGLEASKNSKEASVVYKGHTGQKTTDVLSDAQFITDCHWYEVKGTSVAHFETIFGPDGDMRGSRAGHCEDGVLKMDIYTAWPKETTQSHGLAAEDHGIKIPYTYEIEADGICKASGGANAWILGTVDCEADIKGAEELSLSIHNLPEYNEQGYPHVSKQGLFWADAYVELENGEKIHLSDMDVTYVNIDTGYGIGKDYEGGRVLVTGCEYEKAIPTSPLNHDEAGIIKVNLSGLNAVKFIGRIGADAFPGDEQQRRRTYGVGVKGEAARFITVIEPFEDKNMVESVISEDENTVEVSLKDGRRQKMVLSGIETGKPVILFREEYEGRIAEEEIKG